MKVVGTCMPRRSARDQVQMSPVQRPESVSVAVGKPHHWPFRPSFYFRKVFSPCRKKKLLLNTSYMPGTFQRD